MFSFCALCLLGVRRTLIRMTVLAGLALVVLTGCSESLDGGSDHACTEFLLLSAPEATPEAKRQALGRLRLEAPLKIRMALDTMDPARLGLQLSARRGEGYRKAEAAFDEWVSTACAGYVWMGHQGIDPADPPRSQGSATSGGEGSGRGPCTEPSCQPDRSGEDRMPPPDPCPGDCNDMDNDGRTADDVDADRDGLYES